MKNHKGYSLLELTIVISIVSLGLIAIAVNIGPALVGVKIENVAADMSIAVSLAQVEARRGNTDPQKRTFDLEKADIKPHSGVIVTTQPISEIQNRCSNCPKAESVLCVSGQAFCYSPKSSFTFDKFSGELVQAQVIFVVSKNRTLALLVNQRGEFLLAELINGEWRSRTDLQNLLPAKHNSQPPEGKS